MSALGFLVAKPAFELVHGRIGSLFETRLDDTNGLLAEMEEEARRVVRASVPGAKRLAVQREVAVRYEGQSYELNIPFTSGALSTAQLKRVARDFTAAYSTRYHALVEQSRLETVRWRVRVSAMEEQDAPRLGVAPDATRKALKGRRAVYVADRGGYVSCPVYDRYALAAGSTFSGPAVVEEPESTVYIGSGAKAVITRSGDLRVTRPVKSEGASRKRRGSAVTT
jgi:N-methylhydantoinase A/oxoprolinase/acetone carboxylase beta subunit